MTSNRIPPDAASVPCQLEAFPAELQRGPPSREEPWGWYLRRRLRGARRKAARLIRRMLGQDQPGAPLDARSRDAGSGNELVPGDLVRIRPAEVIRQGLDAGGRTHGCAFADGMYQYCGGEYRVLRVVGRFFDERRWRMLTAHGLVILEGLHCDGSSIPDTRGCDRLCYYFWRTEWLEKIADAPARAGGAAPGSPP